METKIVTLQSFSFETIDGAEKLVNAITCEAEIIQCWEDQKLGQQYIGLIHDDLVVRKLERMNAPVYGSAIKVHFTPSDILNRGGLSKSQLNTLRLIKLLANDLDPCRPKFKSTLDSIQIQIEELKKELKIDQPTQQCGSNFQRK